MDDVIFLNLPNLFSREINTVILVNHMLGLLIVSNKAYETSKFRNKREIENPVVGGILCNAALLRILAGFVDAFCVAYQLKLYIIDPYENYINNFIYFLSDFCVSSHSFMLFLHYISDNSNKKNILKISYPLALLLSISILIIKYLKLSYSEVPIFIGLDLAMRSGIFFIIAFLLSIFQKRKSGFEYFLWIDTMCFGIISAIRFPILIWFFRVEEVLNYLILLDIFTHTFFCDACYLYFNYKYPIPKGRKEIINVESSF
ncbi:unnamed protein product [Caenorhabditis angaria]|uniref:Uncharacterized protein n=1 Tax=Caenorhabditis angaria TaxID=860376 RepID=A0A9P1IDH4_9PELO|nr:unnamed protein product [Caenorhabditis angaria]